MKKVSLYWTAEDQENLEAIARWLKARGLRLERDGKTNVSAVINFVLREKATAIEKAGEKANE